MRAIFEPWRKLGLLPRPVWLACITTLINRLGSMALPFLSLFLTESRHYTESQAGFAVAAYGLAGLVTAPRAGKLVDSIGPFRLIVWSLLVGGTLMAFVPFIPGYFPLVAFVLFWATATEAFRPAAMALVTDSVEPAQKRTAITLYRTALNLGMSIGPAAGGFLAKLSYVWVFAVDSATSILAALFLLRSARAMPPHQPHPDRKGNLAFRDRRAWLYLVSVLPVMLVFFQHTSSMPLYLVRNLHLDPSIYGVLFTLNTVIILALEVPLTVHTSHWPLSRMLAIGALLVSIGFGGLALCHGIFDVALTVVFWTFGEMFLLPSAAAYITDLAPAGRSGEYIGISQMLFSLSFLLGPIIGTNVLEHLGGVTLWTGCFFAGCVSTAMLAFLPQVQKQQAAATTS